MNRLIILIILFIGPALIGGLSSCEEGCNPAPDKFHIGDYMLYTQTIDNRQFNKPLTDTLSSGNKVSVQKLALNIWGTSVRVAGLGSGSSYSAWACDPAYMPLDTIRRFSVISNQDFNVDLTAGKDLSPVLTFAEGLTDFSTPFATVLKNPYVLAGRYYRLQFTQLPSRTNEHQFTISIGLSDGRNFVFKTPTLLITP